MEEDPYEPTYDDKNARGRTEEGNMEEDPYEPTYDDNNARGRTEEGAYENHAYESVRDAQPPAQPRPANQPQQVTGAPQLEMTRELRRLSLTVAIITVIFSAMFVVVFVLLTTGKNIPASDNSAGLEREMMNTEQVGGNVTMQNQRIDELAAQLKSEKEATARHFEVLWTWTSYLASNGLLYKQFANNVNFTEAQQRCDQVGARLASTGIRDQTVRSELKEKKLLFGRNMWIGLHEPYNNGTWVWSDGRNYIEGNPSWDNAKPDNAGGYQDCARTWSRGNEITLDDIDCHYNCPYLCEKEL